MEFESKFNIGDKVYKISPNNQKRWKECDFCGGRAKIKGANQKIRDCPECYGEGGKYEYFNDGWHIEEQLTIGTINIEYRGKSKRIAHGPITFDNYGPQSELYKESYMCAETGIGSGTIHYVGTLFATQEEAQSECDILNEELKGK